ncbi:MAG: hypothetical protein AUH29_11915 [Candidatus Rokubacteria bacterium 13_1_40CM_69_27]|nr:MAG: hypothetical protein AUH29_11915 [Candidatus Rokubacteria bacterium 13_1_40CM_69_27]OLC38362.1 MAG: hypothetical protein AUH81_04215 [Candidatus Rokubacteria bacterium 13_1_40CM_4_69_5]
MRENLVSDFVTVEHLDARDLAIDNVQDEMALLWIQRDVPVPRSPCPSGPRNSIDNRAEVVTAAAPIDKAKLRDLSGEVGLALPLKQSGEFSCQLRCCFDQKRVLHAQPCLSESA